jgi:hypothetical protein
MGRRQGIVRGGNAMGKLLTVDVISPLLGSFDHCSHCQVFLNEAGIGQRIHREDFEAFPEETKAEYERLVQLLAALTRRFQGRVQFRVIDPQTLEGIWKSLRYWVRRYPTFIIDGQKLSGWDEGELVSRIEAHLGVSVAR